MLRKLTILYNAILGNPNQKYSARYQLINRIARQFNFRLYPPHMAWVTDEKYLSYWWQFPGKDRTQTHDRSFNMFSLTKSIKHISGDIAECGVYSGASSFMLLAATDDTDKHLHGFDSFEGLSKPGPEDQHSYDKLNKWKKHDLAVQESMAEANLSLFRERFTLYKGWIPSRFSEVKKKLFCLVHIDVDLFSPTKASLEFFYERLNMGGMIICDDYGSPNCPGALQAMDAFAQSIDKQVIHLTTGQGLIIKD